MRCARGLPSWTVFAGSLVVLGACTGASSRETTSTAVVTSTSVVTSTAVVTSAGSAAAGSPIATDPSVTQVGSVGAIVPSTSSTSVLVDGLQPDVAADWQIVNDGVMGGMSSSSVTDSADGVVFTGSVSLANNGGFASIRDVLADTVDLTGYDDVVVEAVGDGKTYVVELRTDDERVVYWQRFIAATDVTEFVLPLGEFAPHTRFGEPIADGPPLDPSTVRSIGLYILDKQVGTFRIVIRGITAR